MEETTVDQAGSSISPTDDEQESNDQTEQTAAQDEAPPELAGDIDEAPLELADDIQATALSNGDVSTESTWLVDESEGGGEPDQSLVDAREELPSILRSPDLIAAMRAVSAGIRSS
jgi:hypothetical protein